MTQDSMPSTASALERWLVCFQSRPQAQLKLICFPHAGGAPSAFAAWPRDLPDSVELSVVKLPGREERRSEPQYTEIGPLVERLVEVLRPAHDRPVALLGYSLGALLAFEYARALCKDGSVRPAHLIVAACKAPHLPRDGSIANLSEAEFLHQMRTRYDGIPKPILDDPELLAYFLPIIRGDLGLLESYRYAPDAPLRCDITAFGGEEDPRVTRQVLESWRVHTQGNFDAHMFSGGHFFVTPDRRRTVMERIVACLPLDTTGAFEHGAVV